MGEPVTLAPSLPPSVAASMGLGMYALISCVGLVHSDGESVVEGGRLRCRHFSSDGPFLGQPYVVAVVVISDGLM